MVGTYPFRQRRCASTTAQSVGTSGEDITDDDIEQAFTNGTILRTHVMRPTWHFVSPADIRWLLALTAPRVRAASAYYNRKLELDDAVFRCTNAVLANALQGGKQLTRDELASALQQAGIATDGEQRVTHIMMRAEQDLSQTAYLLPNYDEFTVGYTDRSTIFDVLHTNKLDPRGGLLTNTIVLDGQVVGTWKRTFKKNTVVIEANPFTPLGKTEARAFAASANLYGTFLRMPVDSPWQAE